MHTLRAGLRVAVFAFLCLIVVPTQSLLLLFTKDSGAYYIPFLWHNLVRRLFGIRFQIEGRPEKERQTLFMSNHLSYLDIVVIGGVLKSSFVAKSEVETWPLFGLLAKLQQTAFIKRQKSAIRNEKNALESRIARGESLIIFPEGTSSDGQTVLPFKSSLFALALTAPDLYIQPITVKLLETDGRTPESQEDRDLYAWHREMDTPLPRHLWRFAKTSGARIALIFHEPIKAREYNDRKMLAKICHDNVIRGLKAAPIAA